LVEEDLTNSFKSIKFLLNYSQFHFYTPNILYILYIYWIIF